MVNMIDEEEKQIHQLSTLTNGYSATFLTEDGLYEVLMLSRKPIAREFKKQVKLILKQIRETGGEKMATGQAVRIDQKIEIANLYIQGMTYKEIARATNLSKCTVYRMIKNDYETRALLKEMNRNYKEEILDLAVNEMKEILLDDEVSKGLKTTMIATALKYSGAMIDKVEIKEPEMTLEDLYKEFGIK